MELHYGRMVNFEPLVLLLIIASLLCLRRWEVSGNRAWQRAAFGMVFLGLWVDWAMYIFVLVLCAYWFFRRTRETTRMAWWFLAMVVASGVLYLLRIRWLQPTAWESLSETFFRRICSHNSIQFSELQWARRIAQVFKTHLLWVSWPAALVGSWRCWRDVERDPGVRWLGWCAFAVFAMDCLFVGVFQNDSFIHPYIGFYFVLPLAITAGLGFEQLLSWLESRLAAFPFPRFSPCIFLLGMLVLTGYSGLTQTTALRRQFLVLDFNKPEPPDFIPNLGKLIRQNFGAKTQVLCNFLPVYGPQLGYYAQRNLLNNLQDSQSWNHFIQRFSKNEVGGLVWLDCNRGREIMASLPPGEKRLVRLNDMSFCVWNRSRSFSPKGSGLKTAHQNQSPPQDRASFHSDT